MALMPMILCVHDHVCVLAMIVTLMHTYFMYLLFFPLDIYLQSLLILFALWNYSFILLHQQSPYVKLLKKCAF